MNITRLSALLEKDFKESIRNPSIIFMPLMIILISIFYSIIPTTNVSQSAPTVMQFIIINMAFVFVATSPLITMISEENEKGTLKGLVESPASNIEILLSKVIITFIITIITTIISLMIVNSNVNFDFQTYLGLAVMLCFYLVLGLVFGLLSNTVGTATTLMMVPFILFGMTPIFNTLEGVIKLGFFDKVLEILPFGLILELETNHASLNLLYLVIWFILIIVSLFITYKYKFRKR
ncbi:ABC transporter permease [Staphylococcus equorum]|uniref:ABC transporter permease n=1 Tax=Staphylococcus equorum TaxID=246432 RepID=UPI002980D6E9|nr:ABC transporter permease [Staphylococcus equorum]MDW5470114.1 ABC transporter permease [Staphylococcus equorum]